MTDSWDDKFDYLRQSRALYHSEDYWRFLVRDVWRIDSRPLRVADFGCGFGWAGLFLLPMLAPGTEYVGFDRSEPLVKQGRAAFAALPNCSRLIQGATLTPRRSPTASSMSLSRTRSRCICRSLGAHSPRWSASLATEDW